MAGMKYNDFVNYDAMDPFKKQAQLAGRQTAHALSRFRFFEVEMSRGESCYLIDAGDRYLAHLEEGLGTKNLVADTMERHTGECYYSGIAKDTVAMIVNDMITLGALPLSVAMHLAVGDSKWFDNERRANQVIEGWREACEIARCVWGGGETPTLRDVVLPDAVVLSGSAMGFIYPKERLLSSRKIQDGDAIVFLESSGIHANGLTMARKIANEIVDGYMHPVWDEDFNISFPSFREATFGEALLKPTNIYVPIVEDCLSGGIELHYAVNITGHGFRKLMRSEEPFVYVVERLFEPMNELFRFIQRYGPVSDEEAFATFNMGAGFALYVPEHEVPRIVEFAERYHNIRALHAGYIEKRGDEKKVVIEPVDIEYNAETLDIR